MTENKLQTLFQDESFVKDFLAAETPEAMIALLAKNQVEITPEQAKQARLLVEQAKNGELDTTRYVDETGQIRDELMPAELDSAAGGTWTISAASIATGISAVTASITYEIFGS